MSGLFITLEGGEGSGKSTQIKLLKEWFESYFPDKEIICTREPGGTEQAELIRNLLVTGDSNKFSPQTEALLMVAARTEHVQKVIVPALEREAVILCDRFSDSTLVYQGLAHDISVEELVQLHLFGFDDIQPDITFLLDVPTELGLRRARSRQDGQPAPDTAESRFEEKGLAFHQRVRSGFLALSERYNQRYAVIDASQTPEHTDRQVKNVLIQKLKLNIQP